MLKIAIIMLTIAGCAMVLPVAILPMAGPAQSALVVFATAGNPMALPDEVMIESWDGRVAVLADIDAAAARKLYSLGAVLVYPVRPSGCVSFKA